MIRITRTKYKFNHGALIWDEKTGWSLDLGPRIETSTKDDFILIEFIKNIILDLMDYLDAQHPFDTNLRLFIKISKKLFKPYRAKLIKHECKNRLPYIIASKLDDAEMRDLNTRLFSFNFIWSSRILHNKKGLNMRADELCYMLRLTDEDDVYTFERYGVYYEAHGPKSIKESERTIKVCCKTDKV